MTSTIPPHMQAVAPAQEPHRRSAFWFSTLFVGAELLLLIGCLFITGETWFVDHTDSGIGYGHTTAGTACDVLLYGDSTAMYGLNPAIIQQKTGLKACNIAEPGPVGTFLGKYVPVDDYLAGVPKPKYLVTSWVFSNLNLDSEAHAVNEPFGFEYAWRYHRGPWLWKSMFRNPAVTLPLLTWEQSYVMGAPLHAVYQKYFTKRDDRTYRMSHDGWVNTTYVQGHKTGCGATATFIPNPYDVNQKGIEAFRKRYEAQGIKVIVNVSPMVDCTANLSGKMDTFRGLADNIPGPTPESNFSGDDIHLTIDGANRYSDKVADQILALMKNEPGAKQ